MLYLTHHKKEVRIMVKILSFGEILFDVFGDKATLGGAPLNFGAHAAHAGAQSAMLSAVGDDELGRDALAQVRSHGIDTRYTAILGDKMTGRCLVTLNEAGIPKYDLLQGVAYDYIPVPELGDEHYDVLYFGTLSLRADYNRATLETLLARNIADEVFVDMNIRAPFYSDESILMGLKNATMLKISDEELPVIAKSILGEGEHKQDDVIAYIGKTFRNVKLLVLTCGGDGSVCYNFQTGEVTPCQAVKTKVVSTVGAGDSFCATFLVNYLNGVSIPEALAKASKISAYVVSQEGAIPEGMPQV